MFFIKHFLRNLHIINRIVVTIHSPKERLSPTALFKFAIRGASSFPIAK